MGADRRAVVLHDRWFLGYHHRDLAGCHLELRRHDRFLSPFNQGRAAAYQLRRAE